MWASDIRNTHEWESFMSRQYSTMKDRVADRVQDTTNPMKTLIGDWLNRRYKQVLRSINWTYINEDYTITTVSGTKDYNLPSDFGKELYATDTTNNKNLKKIDFEALVRDFSTELTTAGYPQRYSIFKSDDGNVKVRFHYVPSGAYTIDFPYIVDPSEMSADGDTPVIDIEDLIELGAEADAWRYKRQYAKAQQTEILFNNYLSDYIWSKANQPNERVQFKPITYNKGDLY